MYVCVCVCVCVYIYIYIYIHTHTHIHTYMHTARNQIPKCMKQNPAEMKGEIDNQ